MISWILLTTIITSCKYTGEKLTPIFPDFSKQTINSYKAKQIKPLEFELWESAVPFSEVERRILKKEMEPLICFPISQMQEIRREWENSKKNKNIHPMDSNSNSEDSSTTR